MKINISSAVGDPESPRTWSGTTYHISVSLKEMNKLQLSFEPNTRYVILKLLRMGLIAYYSKISKKKNCGPLSWRLLRELNAFFLMKLTNQSISKHTLHFGTLGLPFKNIAVNQHHYLYTDGTWNLWSQHSTNIHFYSIKDIEAIDRLEKKSYEQVSHIFSVSKYVKQNLIEHYKIDPSKISVVGTGTGIISAYYGEKDYNNGKILFAAKGRFEDKGGLLVLDAFELALKKNPNLHLSIVGQNEYTSSIKHPQISAYGFIPVSALKELFKTHSLFLMPALNEPWGLVYIEAMLCKMPIVGLNRNSFPELSGYGKFGTGIDDPNAEMLANVIVEMYSHPIRMYQMGIAAQQYAIKHFNWEKTVKKITDKIEELQIN